MNGCRHAADQDELDTGLVQGAKEGRSLLVSESPAGPLQFFGKPLQFHQLSKAVFDTELEVFTQQCPVDAFLVFLDNRIYLGIGPIRHTSVYALSSSCS
jgi:hypothetical protein